MYCKGKIRLVHKHPGLEFLNKENEVVLTQHDWYKVYHVFQISQQTTIDSDQESDCPASAWMVMAMKSMLHSLEANKNKGEMNMK